MPKVSEAAILQALNLGSARAIVENKPVSPLGELLLAQANAVMEELKETLKKRNINTSSQGLSQSISVGSVEVSPSGISVAVSMDFYWKFVNFGVNGTEINRGAPNWGPVPQSTQSFHEAIKEWIPKRGLILPPNFRDYDSFAFAIMSNIRKFGVEARPFFTDVVNSSLVDVLRDPVAKVFGRAVTISIVEPWQ